MGTSMKRGTHVTDDVVRWAGSLTAATRGDPRIRVAVLDGPVDTSHACFQGAKLERVSTLVQEGASAGGAMASHGTHVASLLFGQPGSPVEGIAPSCRGLIAPVFSDERRSDADPRAQRFVPDELLAARDEASNDEGGADGLEEAVHCDEATLALVGVGHLDPRSDDGSEEPAQLPG